jgi:hypothetical protein
MILWHHDSTVLYGHEHVSFRGATLVVFREAVRAEGNSIRSHCPGSRLKSKDP